VPGSSALFEQRQAALAVLAQSERGASRGCV